MVRPPRPPCAKTIGRPFLPLEKMGSHNGKPVLRDQDVQALAKSSGLGEDQVGSQDQIASAEGPGCGGLGSSLADWGRARYVHKTR